MNGSDSHARPLIGLSGLVKSYGDVRALDGLNLEVSQGQVHGLLGPNGAGKSTAIRVIFGMLQADDGQAFVLGRDPWRDQVALHRLMSYVPGNVGLWPNLNGGQIIDVLSSLRGVEDRQQRKQLVNHFDLDTSRKFRTYSKGNRQKVALVAAFLGNPDLIVLDEPTSGLDPLMEASFTECVRKAASDGATVLLSSHILSEVEALCDHISILRSGRCVESASLSQLRGLIGSHFFARLRGRAPDLSHLEGVHNLEVKGLEIQCDVHKSALDPLICLLSPSGIDELRCTPPTLAHVFLQHYQEVEA